MFEKSVLAQNIQYLASKNGKKLGELEKAAGVSAGYTSRLLKNDEKGTLPIMDLALEASKEFGTPLDMLLTKKLDDVHPNELYLIEFLNKLRDDTLAGAISWTEETREMIIMEHNHFNHPAVAYHYRDQSIPDDEDYYYYKSPFNCENIIDDVSVKTSICGKNFYIVEIKQGSENKSGKKGFEVYFAENFDSRSLEPIICVLFGNCIYDKIRELFSLAMESRNQIMLPTSVRQTIDGYMGRLQETMSDDDLPF